MKADLTKKCGFFISEYFRYAGREKGCIFFNIQHIHVISINVTLKHVKKGVQRIEDIDKPANFRQNCYSITKRAIKKGQRNTGKK